MALTPCILGCGGLRLSPDEARFFRDADPWGFILFGRNVDAPAQLARLTADLRAAVGRDAPILIDQEGGRVQRMWSPHWQDWPAPLDVATRLGTKAAAALELQYRVIGAELAAMGIDVDCAPVLDLARPDTHPFLRNRCLGEDPDSVARNGAAVARGLMAAGVVPVMKHMPGHGAATVDSHKGLPVVTLSRADLTAQDFSPFRALAHLPMGMTGHMVLQELADGPTTLSADVVRVIREDIGFSGLLLTDDLSMGALGGPIGTRARRALDAGCDIALHCNGEMSEMAAVMAELPGAGPDVATRAEHALSARFPQDVVDIEDDLAQYGAMLKEAPGVG